MKYENYFRVCMGCGSFFPYKDSLLCKKCFEKLMINKSQTHIVLGEFEKSILIYSLWHWRPNQSDILSGLLLNLKGGTPKSAFEFYAYLLSVVISKNRVGFLSDLILVPVPNLEEKKNHALALAEAIGGFLNLKVFNCLDVVINDKKPQKERVKHERTEIQFAFKESFDEDFRDSKRVVLVDDIVTTGSTANACMKKIPNIASFEVWTLAYRVNLLNNS